MGRDVQMVLPDDIAENFALLRSVAPVRRQRCNMVQGVADTHHSRDLQGKKPFVLVRDTTKSHQESRAPDRASDVPNRYGDHSGPRCGQHLCDELCRTQGQFRSPASSNLDVYPMRQEWRFITYASPLLTVVAARGADWL